MVSLARPSPFLHLKSTTNFTGHFILFTTLILLCLNISISLSQIEERHAEVHCSRSRSRTARKILDEYLLPFVEEENFNISTTCKLHPQNDIFRAQEKIKDQLRPHHWQCGYCKKVFRSEEFLDKHLNNRHSDTLNISRENCLADVCGAIHCDYVDSKLELHLKKKCNPTVTRRNRHMCESLASSCFPPNESEGASRLHDFFLRQFCDAHSCDRGLKVFPRGDGRHGTDALYYVAITFTLCILFLVYGTIYIHTRDTNLMASTLKRLSQHDIYKSERPKQY